jgi:hypothetical protein
MKVWRLSRLCFVAALALGLIVAWSSAVPTATTRGLLSIVGGAADGDCCWGTSAPANCAQARCGTKTDCFNGDGTGTCSVSSDGCQGDTGCAKQDDECCC